MLPLSMYFIPLVDIFYIYSVVDSADISTVYLLVWNKRDLYSCSVARSMLVEDIYFLDKSLASN